MAGVPDGVRPWLVGDGEPLDSDQVWAVRSEVAFLAALAVVTGVFTHPGLVIVPVAAAVFDLARLPSGPLRQVVGGGHPSP